MPQSLASPRIAGNLVKMLFGFPGFTGAAWLDMGKVNPIIIHGDDMPSPDTQPSKITSLAAMGELGFMVCGAFLQALAINGILVPHGFLSGGFTGMSLTAHYLLPILPVSLMYLALNLPQFAMAYKLVNRRFFWLSLLGMGLVTAALWVVKIKLPVEGMVPAAVLAGIINGAGAGLTLRSRGSAGGSDILSVILYRRFSIRLGTTYLAIDAGVLAMGACLFPLELMVYSLIFLFVNSQVMNLVVTGMSKRKAIMIITQREEEVLAEVKAKTVGATLIPAEGAYSGESRKIIYTVVTLGELARVKQIIRDIDPQAFVVISETMEVMGLRMRSSPDW
jgi:uncharacterized membrane-anchored protein YitT (DUF2179 family)